MFCGKCGSENNANERFCRNCGNLITGQQFLNNQQPVNMNNQSGNLAPNYVQKSVNPKMTRWAILSIIVPVAGIILYMTIGLSFYLAMLIVAAGFGFAQKGEMSAKKLATVGKVANGTLAGIAIISYILLLFNL